MCAKTGKSPSIEITVLSDNTPCGNCEGEWGLSFYIKYRSKNYLLDAGFSGLFAENAKKLGINLADVEAAFLSHSHDDHSNGFPVFFGLNQSARLYLQPDCGTNYFNEDPETGEKTPGGVPEGMMEDFADRIVKVDGVKEVFPGITIIPHSTPGLAAMGEKNRQFADYGNGYEPDNFSHEQSVVFDTPDGLVIFNSCSHGGVDVIISEVQAAFPGRDIAAYLGGLHMFPWPDEDVLEAAGKLKKLGLRKLYTGHCTGPRACELLKEQLGSRTEIFHAGLHIEL